jgi:hypothetical protein
MTAGDEDGATRIKTDESDFYAELSDYLEALSHPSRLKIVASVEGRPKDMRRIAAEIGTSYENTKKHVDRLVAIGVLRKTAGIGQETSRGVHPVWEYSLVPGGLGSVLRNLSVIARASPSDPGIARKIASLREGFARDLAWPGGVVIVIGGPDDSTVIPLTGDRIRVGRGEAQDRTIPGRGLVLSQSYASVTRISRPHAWLHGTGGRWMIEDAGSTGGTRINGKLLPAGQKHPLSDGDLIELGSGLTAARLVIVMAGHRESTGPGTGE